MQNRQQSESDLAEERGMSWVAMLLWIALAFALAAFIAYWLVKPFFHHA